MKLFLAIARLVRFKRPAFCVIAGFLSEKKSSAQMEQYTSWMNQASRENLASNVFLVGVCGCFLL